jgi:cytoskeletal protein RodZ
VEARVRIGEALAEARSQAGLTVAEVSLRTRIRETIIRDIEDDDYSACGGDFYTRGNIRSIAKAVGADPEPLIREYDEVHRAPGVLSAVSLDELLTPVKAPGRRRPNWTAMLALVLVVALGFVAYHVLSGLRHVASTPPAAANHAVTGAGQSRVPPALKASRSDALNVHPMVVDVTAIRSCWVVFRTPSGRHLSRSHVAVGASTTWTFRHAVDLTLDDPGGVTMTVDGKNPLPPKAASRPVMIMLRPGHPATVAVRTLTGPVPTVRAYINAINDHRYAQAWHLGGRNAGGSFSSFVSGFRTTARDTLAIVSVSGDVVTARLTAQQTDGTVTTYQGTYSVDHGVITGFDILEVG